MHASCRPPLCARTHTHTHTHTLDQLQQDESWPGVWVSNVESARLYQELSLGSETTSTPNFLGSTPKPPKMQHIHKDKHDETARLLKSHFKCTKFVFFTDCVTSFTPLREAERRIS